MKKLLVAIIFAMFLISCKGYTEPDVKINIIQITIFNEPVLNYTSKGQGWANCIIMISTNIKYMGKKQMFHLTVPGNLSIEELERAKNVIGLDLSMEDFKKYFGINSLGI
jgi:hypothetical protein